ncbi:hypothetical protein EDC01DRAFT_645391 [Geopyxis carbonaria]|nr:hypothetical protein EDC01DRAFT_645391 [Geopyxis carbonaria]
MLFNLLTTGLTLALTLLLAAAPSRAAALPSAGDLSVRQDAADADAAPPLALTTSDAPALENAFSILTAIPDTVLESGDAATQAWLDANKAALEPPSADADGTRTLGVGGCIWAITKVIVEGLLPAAKILRVKRIVQQLGGIRKAVQALLRAKEKWAEAGEIVKELFYLVSGLDEVRKNCF